MRLDRPRTAFGGWLYRVVMRAAHRYGWHCAPRMLPPTPAVPDIEGLGGTKIRRHQHWCRWCGLHGETLETIWPGPNEIGSFRRGAIESSDGASNVYRFTGQERGATDAP